MTAPSAVNAPLLTSAQVNQFIRHMPFNVLCGIRCIRVHRDGLTLEVKLRPELMNGAGSLHGGVYATLADVAVGLALHRQFSGERKIVTTDLKINYFRPVSQGVLRARARILRRGAHLCTGQVELVDAGRNLVAVAIVTYMVVG